MKSLFSNPMEVLEITKRAAQFDSVTIMSMIGMLIDITADQTRQNPLKIVQEVREAVEAVNQSEGTYHNYQEQERAEII